MAIYLSLGSNLGERRDNLRTALAALARESVTIERVSPVVESPALLPAGAPADWNSPFLNLVAECSSSLTPQELLGRLKRIEHELGRADERHWAPRPIDIDILLYHDDIVATDELTVPHAGLAERAFALTPLAALRPGLRLPSGDQSANPSTALDACRALGCEIPLWMGIINLTPDSFSDGGDHETSATVEDSIDMMVAHGIHYLDFGAESTRPGAILLTAEEEWSRLEPALSRVLDKFANDLLRPQISVDTYHVDVAARALKLGVDVINDVSGLTQPEMIELAAANGATFVAMHNLGLPADPTVTLDTNRSAVDQVEAWLDDQLETWLAAGIDPDRIIFDPGVGFGKNPLQSLELLRDIRKFQSKGLRILVGHSRKSFMGGFSGADRHERDLVTIGSSMALCERGVDILRVHNVADHITAYRGWVHSQAPE